MKRIVMMAALVAAFAFTSAQCQKPAPMVSADTSKDRVLCGAKAICVNETVYLQWLCQDTTASTFMVYRSDNKGTHVVGTVRAGLGRCRGLNLLYCLQDNEACGDCAEYIIKQMDADGNVVATATKYVTVTCGLSYGI